MPDLQQPESTGLAWLKGRRVLLAEDNFTNQMVATQMLDSLGMRVDVANDGAEALEMIERHRYDIYLIDIEMPRVSGIDVIRAIREAPAPLCEAPVIAVTAYALREHREKIADAGADGVIPKPLIGIEQFGRDILGFCTRALRRASAEDDEDEGPDSETALGAAQPVSMAVFNALSETLGPEAIGDLLSKIDSDLEKAVGEIAAGRAADDRRAISAATHNLISVSGAIGAQSLQRLAQKLNAVANARGEGDLDALVADVSMQVTMLRAFVQSKVRSGRG